MQCAFHHQRRVRAHAGARPLADGHALQRAPQNSRIPQCQPPGQRRQGGQRVVVKRLPPPAGLPWFDFKRGDQQLQPWPFQPAQSRGSQCSSRCRPIPIIRCCSTRRIQAAVVEHRHQCSSRNGCFASEWQWQPRTWGKLPESACCVSNARSPSISREWQTSLETVQSAGWCVPGNLVRPHSWCSCIACQTPRHGLHS